MIFSEDPFFMAHEGRSRDRGTDIIECDEPMREYISYITGQPYTARRVDRNQLINLKITEPFINALAHEALATLLYRTRRGHVPSADMLQKLALGSPERPFREKIRERKMTLSEAKAEFTRLATEKAGWKPELAEQYLERVVTPIDADD